MSIAAGKLDEIFGGKYFIQYSGTRTNLHPGKPPDALWGSSSSTDELGGAEEELSNSP